MTGPFALALWLAMTAFAQDTEPQWMWLEGAKTASFRGQFGCGPIVSAILEITADDAYEAYLDGRRIGGDDRWQTIERYELVELLKPGRHVLAVRATDAGTAAGLWARLILQPKDGNARPTNIYWKAAESPAGSWRSAGFNDGAWKSPKLLGPMGAQPWGKLSLAAVESVRSPKKRKLGAGIPFVDGDRVLLLGAGFFERELAEGRLETELTRRMPERNVTFRNLGWSGDTVENQARSYFGPPAEGRERLREQLKLIKPTVVLACYGANEAFGGEAARARFVENYAQLLETIESDTGAAVIVLAPPAPEDVGPPFPSMEKAAAEARDYRAAALQLARVRGWGSVDFGGRLESAGLGSRERPLTSNGLHFTDDGYRRIANLFAASLGYPDEGWDVRLDLSAKRVTTRGAKVTDWMQLGGKVNMTIIDGTLPPADEERNAAKRRLSIRGLPAGKHVLRTEGKNVLAADARQWSEGVSFTAPAAVAGSEALRRRIVDKNTTFFHRYRPQNETYIFGFRKHEQGNNAVEIPQFDPLINADEKAIETLKLPVSYKLEIVRAEDAP
ncbi:MAG TPA: GDSL-type esterase/lipase family protein [Planctomycetia bacterium]|nr:GDSL-type esterase/lipase family protein [Planctomycetia bacterium]